MGQCLAKFQDGGTQNKSKDTFPDYYTESQICDYYVDRLPPRLLGEGIHLLRGGPGPIVCSWTHELLNDAGVRTFQDRELLLKTRDEIVAAVQAHRQRLLASRTSFENKSRGSFENKSRGSFENKSRTPSTSPDLLAISNNNSASSASPGSETASNPNSPSGAGGPIPPDAATAAAATPFDKAAARQATAAAEAAAAAAAADAAAATTAFRSEGDGKSFRLTTDWLPAGLQLYRISEEMRHMASSGLGGAANSADVSAHGRSSVLGDVSSLTSKAAAVAGPGGSSPVQLRSKSRLATVSSGVPADFNDDDNHLGGAGDGEKDAGRDDERDVRDRDDAAAVATAAAVSTDDKLDVGPESPRQADGVQSAAATGDGGEPPAPRDTAAAAAASAVATGGGCSCDSSAGSSGRGSGGGGGEFSGSSGSRSPASTLGAESLAALTSLEPTGGTTSPLPSSVEPSPLGAAAAGEGAADAAGCAVRSGGCDAAAAVLGGGPRPRACQQGCCGGAAGSDACAPRPGPGEEPTQPRGGVAQLQQQEQGQGQIVSAA
ncbi:hypothetical protein PLESTB_001865300 [Pleodorina starrii]|uniref:Uncharacterized protein n=1 Tax=Pleodorina starrii TaxID=330485 RepID=A0A9W6FAB5_9CHLO|nr:hypothetical protein PLESTM_001887700 [Pleodorina starrii]GLC62277.1 hypothetical protein PLESTB_001865300 [Pleodorina starrii]GLC70140.1 hypothetical protein PLESTF_000929300 [Pleodorina starrii]